MIAAILRAQFLSMRLRAGSRGGAAFSVITGLMFYGVWTFLAWGAMLFFSDESSAPYFVAVLSSGLMFVMLYWQLAPVISASFGASIDLRKLLAYPIPHNQLFTIEILLRLTTCIDMLIVITGACAGLLRNRLYGAHAAVFILGGAGLFVALNVLLSAGMRSLLERVFARSKLKEVLIFLLVMAGMAPRILIYMHLKKSALLRFAPSQTVWPWAAAGRVMLHQSAGPAVFMAILWLTAALVFSRWQFEQSLRFDVTAIKRLRRTDPRDSWTERFFEFPSRVLRDPIAAIVEKELRTLARIPRFRLVFAMSCFFGIAMSLPLLNSRGNHAYFGVVALPFMALYGLMMLGQISYWNSLGFDRSAVQGYFSWPVRFRDVLIAKNLTVVCILIPQLVVISIIARAMHLPSNPAKILETLVVIVIASLYWFAMGNIFSVRMPRALDPEKSSNISKQTQAATIWAAPLLLAPLVLAYWARWFFESEVVFVLLVLLAAVVGGIFYWVGLDSAVKTAYERRESIVTKLSKTEGPLSAT